MLLSQRFELVWSDEFDAEQLDITDTWNVWSGTAFNNELQCYTARPQNLYLEDGKLVLMARRENFFCGNRYLNYTSARISTDKTPIGWEYGRFEARIRMPNGQGFWPAFWLLPIRQIGWPRGGEIDIMEFRGNVTNVTNGAIHFWRGGCTGTTLECRKIIEGSHITGFDLTADFHVYSLEWTPESMKWFFDGHQFLEIKKSEIVAEFNPFTEPFYIILNLAVGGNFLPNPDANTPFPQALYVDYVRVYQDVNEPPTFQFEDGSARHIPTGEPISISVIASDSDGFVEKAVLMVNGVDYIELTETPFVFELEPPMEGCYELNGYVIDNDGARSEPVEPVPLTVESGCGAAPYGAAAFEIPGIIPLWQFNRGGQGVGYFDMEPGLNKGVLSDVSPRPYDGVDTREATHLETEYSVFDAVPGEWLEYFINAERDTVFDIEVDIKASVTSSVEIYVNDVLLTSVNRIRTDSVVTYTRTGLTVPAGLSRLRIAIRTGNLELYVVRFRFGTIVSIPEGFISSDSPENIRLLPVYPNPFNPATRVTFDMDEPARVNLRVYDVGGRLIKTLLDDNLPSGRHQVSLNLGTKSSGVYILVLDSDEVRLSQFVTLMK